MPEGVGVWALAAGATSMHAATTPSSRNVVVIRAVPRGINNSAVIIAI
jgi:hypothetical protein